MKEILQTQIQKIYKKSWEDSTHEQLIEELEILYMRGLKGLENMSIAELKTELEDQREQRKEQE
mgnify:CR=1 FL=1